MKWLDHGNTFGALALALMVTVIGNTPAHADNLDLLDTLHHNHVITDKQYTQLKAQAKAQAAKGKAAAEQKAIAKAPPSSPLTSRISGYLQLDAPLTVSNARTIGSRTDLRRLFLEIKGEPAPDWHYYGSFGYYNGAPYVTQATVSYSGWRWATITAGHTKLPYSVAHLTSAKNLVLPEWPLPVMALLPSKRIGTWMSTHGSRWSVAGGVFGGDFNQTADEGVEGRWGAGLRGTVLPWRNADGFWELGSSFAWSEADSNHAAGFGYRPETFVVASKLAATTLTGVDWFSTAGAETQLQWRSWRLQGEYLLTNVARGNAAHLTFSGWYAQTSWIATGERRALSADAVPGGVVPRHPLSNGGWGAWELATRYSVLNLNDANISGGRERTFSAGVNWYPEAPVKLMLAWIHVLPMQGGKFSGVHSNIAMLRLQLVY